MIEPSHLDKYTMSKLAQAATNVDVARHLDSGKFLDMVQDVRNIYVGDPDTSSDATKLLDRIQGWHALADALVNPDGDFAAAATLLKDVGNHELAFGIWLESMIAHPDIFEQINHEIAIPLSHPPNLLQDPPTPTNHQDFLAFVKAYVGVALCIAVYAWSDSLPNARCRERVLGILRLWQAVDGYREVCEGWEYGLMFTDPLSDCEPLLAHPSNDIPIGVHRPWRRHPNASRHGRREYHPQFSQ